MSEFPQGHAWRKLVVTCQPPGEGEAPREGEAPAEPCQRSTPREGEAPAELKCPIKLKKMLALTIIVCYYIQHII